jgi:hypothetical protein
MSNKFKNFEWNLQYNVLEDFKVYKIQINFKKFCKGYMTLEGMKMSWIPMVGGLEIYSHLSSYTCNTILYINNNFIQT